MTPLLVALALGPLLASSSPAEEGVAFVHANVVPMDTERVLTDHALVVRDGRIVALGPAGEVDVPAGVTIIDAHGGYLLPGLADMHVHTWIESDLIAFLASGVTTVRNMFGTPQQVTWREEIARGERLGPTICTAGPLLDGSPPYWPDSRVVDGPADARAAVAEHRAEGYDFIKVYSRLSAESYAAIVAAAKEAGLPVMGHVPDAVTVEEALSAGQRTIEHLGGYESWLEADDSPVRGRFDYTSRLRTWQFIDEAKIPSVVARTKSSGVGNCVTLVVMDKFLPADAIGPELEMRYLRVVHPLVREQWREMAARRAPFADVTQKSRPARLRLTRALHDAGARMVLGTDMGNPFVVPGAAVHEELALLVEAGFSPFDALAAATREAATCLGQEDQFGTLAPGRRADVILLEANPLDDVTNADLRRGVMVRGRWFPEDELQQRIDELFDDE